MRGIPTSLGDAYNLFTSLKEFLPFLSSGTFGILPKVVAFAKILL